LAAYAPQRKSGKQLWWYQSCASHGCETVGGEYFRGWPSYAIDTPPVANRIMPWLAWKYGIDGELYYNLSESPDPWTTIHLFGGNGDGTLLYPGTPARIGGDSHIPIETIRLKLIRDGLEDYEYLSLLAARGQLPWARQQLDQLVRSAYDWEQDPGAFLTIRDRLGEKLSGTGADGAG
jgi:hypothetical protein